MIRTQRTRSIRQYAHAIEHRFARQGFARWALRQAGCAAAVAVFAQARLMDDISPFATTCFAAGLGANWPVGAMLAGCALGSAFAPDGLGTSALPGCLMILALWQLLRALAPWLKLKKSSLGEEIFRSQDAWIASFAGLGTLVPALLIGGASPITAGITALIAALIAPTLVSALSIAQDRRLLMPDEQLSLSLFLLIAIAGLGALPGMGAPAARFAACLLTLIAAGHGATTGATAGLALGLSMVISGGDPLMGAALGACGLMSGAVRRLSRPAQALAFGASAVLSLSYFADFTMPDAAAVLPAGLACLAYCVVPLGALRRVWRLTDPRRRRRVDPQNLAVRLRRSAEDRVRDVGKVFQALAGGYGAPPRLPDEQALMGTMRARLCDGCAGYQSCWCGEEQKAGRLLCKLLGDALTGQTVLSAAELPPDISRQCRRAPQLERRLGAMLNEFADRRRAELNRAECRGLMSRQFSQAAQLLDSLSNQLHRPVELDADSAHLTAAALDREALNVADVMALRGDRLEIVAVLGRGGWSAAAARRAARRLSEELGVSLAPVLKADGEESDGELRFVEMPHLTISAGLASRSHQIDSPSGDNSAAVPLPGGRFMLALSDGMGSGAQAAAESAGALSLLTTFMTADVERRLALDAVNGLMMLSGGDEMFATVDLCVVDLVGCTASFSKLGACASVVLRGREIIRVAGGRLPLGILEQVRPTQASVALREGDLIVMVTDGIADSTRSGQEEWLQSLLSSLAPDRPEAMSARILQAAIEREGGNPADDMTVLVARVEPHEVKFI